jgi:hypothetical protein
MRTEPHQETSHTKPFAGIGVPEPPHEPITAIAARLRKQTQRADYGMTLVALEVMRLSKSWEATYYVEAGLIEFETWLRREVDSRRPLSWYADLARAAQNNPTLKKRLESGALLWFEKKNPTEAERERSRLELHEAFRENDNTPLSTGQVTRRLRHLITNRTRPMPRDRKRERNEALRLALEHIERLKAQIRKLGAVPVP